jgi:hypothetical protein
MPPISIPIIDQLTHPALGLLTRTASLGAFTDNGTLTPPQDPLVALTYGLTWSFFTVPAGYGRVLGDPDVFFDRMIQFASEYDLLGGHSVLTQVTDERTDGAMYLWEEPLPSLVHYTIAPGVTALFYWLQT